MYRFVAESTQCSAPLWTHTHTHTHSGNAHNHTGGEGRGQRHTQPLSALLYVTPQELKSSLNAATGSENCCCLRSRSGSGQNPGPKWVSHISDHFKPNLVHCCVEFCGHHVAVHESLCEA